MSTPTGKQSGATVKDVAPQDFIVALAQHFKKSQKVCMQSATSIYNILYCITLHCNTCHS